MCAYEGHSKSGLDTMTCIKVSLFLFINQYSADKIKESVVIQHMACIGVKRSAYRIFGGEN